MEEVEFLKWIALAIMGGFTYMLKRELNSKDSDIQSLKNAVDHIKQNYLHRDDFKEFKQELRDMFVDIKEDIRAIKASNERS